MGRRIKFNSLMLWTHCFESLVLIKECIEEMPSENYRSFFLVLCKRGRSKARLKIKHASINPVRREEGKSVNEKMLA